MQDNISKKKPGAIFYWINQKKYIKIKEILLSIFPPATTNSKMSGYHRLKKTPVSTAREILLPVNQNPYSLYISTLLFSTQTNVSLYISTFLSPLRLRHFFQLNLLFSAQTYTSPCILTFFFLFPGREIFFANIFLHFKNFGVCMIILGFTLRWGTI